MDYGPAGGSYYYSRTRMDAVGSLVLDGVTYDVEGDAWFDHQWGDFVSLGSGGGWDWYAIMLDDGTEVVLNRVRAPDGSYPVEYGEVVGADGTTRHLPGDAFDIETTGSWTSPETGTTWPAGWRVSIPGEALEMTLEPTVADQELDTRATTGVIYWEGSQVVTATRDGRPIGARGVRGADRVRDRRGRARDLAVGPAGCERLTLTRPGAGSRVAIALDDATLAAVSALVAHAIAGRRSAAPVVRDTSAMRIELTKRGDYAVRAMVALASGPDGSLLSVRRIADEMDIPVRFLPQVMGDLTRAGLVTATTGRSGGYRLARPASAISLLDVVEAVEGDSRRRTCILRGGPCGLDGHCDVHEPFFAAQDAMIDRLSAADLASVARGRAARARDAAGGA